MIIAFEAIGRSGSGCAVDAAGAVIEHVALDGIEAEVGLAALVQGLYSRHGVPHALAVAAGPGSFTGLRVAVVLARTLAWMDALPVHPVDSLVALALMQGDGLWWPLVPLKRDTTFHALVRVASGRAEVIAATIATADDDQPTLDALTSGAVAVGPALTQKPGLAERWCPGARSGSPAMPDARG
ncbi:MAG: hypothetical protein H0X45_06405, partial [Planctomycetes bacterium]|nr:hypothetical protein [Planctomycetota bacterium]